jgi:hypothetical protein
MPDRSLLKLLCAGGFLMLGAQARPAHAATINEGTLSAQVDGQTPVSASFSTTPYVTPVTSTADDASSTTTPDATGLVFKGTFSQSVDLNTAAPSFAASPADSGDPTAAGQFQIDFNANAGDTYSLFGGETPSEGYGTLSVALYDESTSTSIYSYSNSGTGVVSADSSGGPTAGTLAAGDYVFTLDASLVGPVGEPDLAALTPSDLSPLATLTGSGGITLVSTGVVPEPTAPIVLLTCGGALLLGARRRRRAA